MAGWWSDSSTSAVEGSCSGDVAMEECLSVTRTAGAAPAQGTPWRCWQQPPGFLQLHAIEIRKLFSLVFFTMDCARRHTDPNYNVRKDISFNSAMEYSI